MARPRPKCFGLLTDVVRDITPELTWNPDVTAYKESK